MARPVGGTALKTRKPKPAASPTDLRGTRKHLGALAADVAAVAVEVRNQRLSVADVRHVVQSLDRVLWLLESSLRGLEIGLRREAAKQLGKPVRVRNHAKTNVLRLGVLHR